MIGGRLHIVDGPFRQALFLGSAGVNLDASPEFRPGRQFGGAADIHRLGSAGPHARIEDHDADLRPGLNVARVVVRLRM
jgi:hypothetical protein